MSQAVRGGWFAIILLAAPGGLCAQFDESGDLLPGLLGRYTSRGVTIERLDPMVSFDWGRSMPDERLPDGTFEVHWTSQILMREEATVTFHAFVEGSVTVEIDGQTVLDSATTAPQWVTGNPVDLTFGFLQLSVRFRRSSQQGQVHLYWSSDSFPIEPLPQHQLFRDEARPDLALIHTGRVLFDAYRCNRCHVREHDESGPPAPGLLHVIDGLNRDWLVRKLSGHESTRADAQMPDFGFSRDDVEALAAWIEHFSQPAGLIDIPRVKTPKEGPPDGDLLLKSVGCLACHVVKGEGVSGPFGGGDLSEIGAKRSREWLYTWLSRPEKINVQHQMPLIRLTPLERVALAETLSRLGREADATFDEASLADKHDTELVRRGRELAQASRCAACHNIPAMEADVSGVPSLEQRVDDWEGSCLGSDADPARHRPVYHVAERDALKAYVTSRIERHLSQRSDFERGQDVLARRNCLACHERNQENGIVATAGRVSTSDTRLRGQSQALIPPVLTAVGDKLHDDALREAVRGAQRAERLPWLKVRMPQFQHQAEDEQALLTYLIGQDRVPDRDAQLARRASDAGGPQSSSAPNVVDEQTLIVGHTLAGAGGFNCVACHKFGEYEPRNVALGTRGSDLLGVGRRMRSEFFHRWTRAPLRVVPGIEMPNFNKPVPGVLDDDVDLQLQALWAAIHDPRFKAPTNPTQVEQFLVVADGASPRVIRDVFTVGDEHGGGFVARSLAMGFGNGHSILFDLDRFCVRGWTLGDFARQRTEGKSWYWDLAGVELLTNFGHQPDVVLQITATGNILEPIEELSRQAELLEYATDSQSVTSRHRLTFDIDGGRSVIVRQEWRVIEEGVGPHGESSAVTGIQRRLTVDALPEGYHPLWRSGEELSHVGNASISPLVHAREPFGPGQLHAIPAGTVGGLDLLYQCRLERPRSEVIARPELPRNDAPVTTLPGFLGERLKLPASIMPTAIGWDSAGELVFTSLKGHVYRVSVEERDGPDGLPATFEEGLPAPFGILADGDDLLVATKADLLRLKDSDGDGRCDTRIVEADGWGYSDNYHDWTTGPVRDSQGNLYLALGSDYQQEGRPKETTRWRGKVIRVATDGSIQPFAHELRFPQGIALDSQDRLFVTDQQGVANTFNEINFLREGQAYGVKSLYDPEGGPPETRAAVQVPHPWTRSVNGLFFLPEGLEGPLAPFAGHGIGCEYNGKFLIRFSLQEVGGELQGATYEFSRPNWSDDRETFLGPICGALSQTGDLYIGSIFDSGWLGGPNTGEIVRLRPDGTGLPNGIRELRALSDGFEVEFLGPVSPIAAVDSSNYLISGYTRVWEGAYATPDSGQYTPEIMQVVLSDDARTVRLKVDELRERYVYDVRADIRDADDRKLFPHTGYYTMNRIPTEP